MKRKRLGELLQERGKISAESLQQLFSDQKDKAIRLGELILERGLVEKSALTKALEEVSRVPYMDCTNVTCDPQALHSIPHEVARRLSILPIRMEPNVLVVAMAEPQNLPVLDELRFISGKTISPRIGFLKEIAAGISRNYGSGNLKPADQEGQALGSGTSYDSLPEMEFVSTSSRQANKEAIQEIQAEINQKSTPAVRLVTGIIRDAISRQASDIHIEPQSAATFVRIRVDGVLRELTNIPRALQNSLISRVKILSDMDIGERRAPQDGRFMVAIGPHKIDLRVSTLPTQYGEKIVIRLLETSAPLLSFATLGFPPEISERITNLLSLPQGMLLVTGPTGSGKSTTLYSALNLLRRPAVNIVTVEDPVEYELAGINQVHVNTKAGLTFASCLRSILRQDPNVIMVGEIRDLETAEIALKAAQTGHLVLSTLHTNDSISAVARLLDLGIPEYLISSSLTGILGQRLVRKLCACRKYEPPSHEHTERLFAAGWPQVPARVARPVGCSMCDKSGYKGRVGIYELLVLDQSVRAALRGGFKPEIVRNAALGSGMRRMQDDAFEKLFMGVTTLEEILRVVPVENVALSECTGCGHELLPAFQFCPYCGLPRGIGERSQKPAARPVPDGVLP
ncbi:MAG: Flp pilus assembly complex ATPase component TadA [Acidobacteriia bacterium]|nr:Flp pilus assembly complex ATPase component TadA [Terriglobia bacterium]